MFWQKFYNLTFCWCDNFQCQKCLCKWKEVHLLSPIFHIFESNASQCYFFNYLSGLPLILTARHNPYPAEYLLRNLSNQITHFQIWISQGKQRKECKLGQKLSTIFWQVACQITKNSHCGQLDFNCCKIYMIEAIPLIIQKWEGHRDWLVDIFLQCPFLFVMPFFFVWVGFKIRLWFIIIFWFVKRESFNVYVTFFLFTLIYISFHI